MLYYCQVMFVTSVMWLPQPFLLLRPLLRPLRSQLGPLMKTRYNIHV